MLALVEYVLDALYHALHVLLKLKIVPAVKGICSYRTISAFQTVEINFIQ